MRIPLALLLCLLNWNWSAASDDLPKQLRIQVEWIEVTQATLTELMENQESIDDSGAKSANDGPLRSQLGEMINTGEAIMLDTAVTISRSGQRSKVESVREMIYPTEFRTPEWQEIVDNEEGEEGEPEEEDEVEHEVLVIGVPVPDAFEVRNVGTTLEVDPVLGADNVTIDLNLNPEIVFHIGETTHETRQGEATAEVTMPLFYTIRVTTAATLRAGEPLLLGVESPPNLETGEVDRARKVLVFVKADVLVVGK